jgi:FkbM family methyltransferase
MTTEYIQNNVTFMIRPDTHDKMIVDQIWNQVHYKRYEIQAGWVVLDIGAHIGAFALLAWNKGATVYAFEPERENFAYLCENVRRNAATISVHNDAIMGETGPATLYKWSKSKGNTGSYGMYFKNAKTETETVSALSLAGVVGMTGPLDLVKLDCEGAEYDILMKAPPETLAQVKNITMEWHRGIDLARGLREFLEANGFVIDEFKTLCCEGLNDGSVYEYGTMDAHHA